MEVKPRVQWKSFDQLEASLCEFQRLYADCPDQRRELRAIVIRTKDRARYASRNPKVAAETRAAKAEMVEWMLVWLGDPAMFADWVRLRRQATVSTVSS
jgi:hypothetical protein